MIYFRTIAAALFACAMTGGAYAVPITGSDSVIVVSVSTSPATDLLSTVANNGTINLTNLFWGGGSGNFALIPSGTTVNNTSLTISPAGLASFSFTSVDGSFAGAASITVGPNTYTSQVTNTGGSVAGGSETVGLYLVGTFTPANTTSGFDPDNMSVTLTLNETGVSGTNPSELGSFSASISVAAPAATPPVTPPVPEPLSVLLLGSGLLGLAATRWKRG